MRLLATFLLLVLSSTTCAADLAKVDRTLKKEPKYTGTPRYCLLAFGAEAKHRVWLVQDGNTLYVDRNGNGDLTEADEKVIANKPQLGDSEGAYEFEVGELRVGGKVHKALVVYLAPLKSLADNMRLMAVPQIAAAIKNQPNAVTADIMLDVESASLKGNGPGGRVRYAVGDMDTQGMLQLAPKPTDAPVIHFDGPLQITFYGNLPTWTSGRSLDTALCVGTPGSGPGTFAYLRYEGTIPDRNYPKIEATYTPKDPSRKSVKELYELKDRC